MEHTGVYHLKLANYSYENDYNVAVINPFSIKKFMEAKMTRVKTDKADSHTTTAAYNAKKSKRIIKSCINEKIEREFGILR
jgi:transposase